MDFKSFFFGMSVDERDRFAASANTTRGLLTQLAYGNKKVELGLADVLCALSCGQVGLDDIPLTANAQAQRLIRSAAHGSAEAKA